MNDEQLLKDVIAIGERGKSNTHQIDELKLKVNEMSQFQVVIFELTTSVKLIAQDLGYIKETVNKVELGQIKLSEKTDKQFLDVKCEQKDLKENVEGKIDTLSDKTKFDWAVFLTKVVLPALIGGGALGTALSYFSSIFK